MADESAELIDALLAATKPIVAEAAQRGERVGHLLLVLGAGRFCAEAGPAQAAATLREFAALVEAGRVQDPYPKQGS